MTLTAVLLAAACLFALGCFGLLARRQLAGMVMGGQLMGLAVVLALLALDRAQPSGHPNRGEGFALLVAVAGLAQAAIGLALAHLVGTDAGEREEAAPGRQTRGGS